MTEELRLQQEGRGQAKALEGWPQKGVLRCRTRARGQVDFQWWGEAGAWAHADGKEVQRWGRVQRC